MLLLVVEKSKIIITTGDEMEAKIVIDEMVAKDWGQVRDIYIEGINTGNATFDTEAPSWEKWNNVHRETCRLVARDGENVIGWAALSSVSSKKAYDGVAEVSIYLSGDSTGRGIGSKLLKALIETSEANGFWTLQSGIFPENKSSITLHKNFDFTEVGVRKRVGQLHGVWRDVVMLERRSSIVGV
ncbi:GNAT family N-acetyltransferase [Virgibacillus byunsanensis]|uniref:GNAT family N-acetyltransferase n=1 Tax=Virgibacillus byunsanensis TaxID=570945 RepID=A0ABW3LKG7_9BACI